MIREEFLRLAAAGYNRIPLACETLADFDTPLSIYLKLADQPNSYLLESVQGGEKWGRYSIIGLPCRTVLRVHDHHVSITVDGVETKATTSKTRWPSSKPSRPATTCRPSPACRVSTAAWWVTSATTACVMWKSAWANARTRTRWACRTSC
jgi:anthranilate/para-aminobenzoate synthase component I